MNNIDFWLRNAAVSIGQFFPGQKQSLSPKIEKVRISFNIIKTSETPGNKATIQIYNIKDSTRSHLKQSEFLTKLVAGTERIILPKIIVILEVGYMGTGIERLFIGEVERHNIKKVGPNWITEIVLKSGKTEIEETVMDKTYRGKNLGLTDSGIDIKKVVGDLKDKIKSGGRIAADKIKDRIKSKKLNNGLVVSGKAMDSLKNIFEKDDQDNREPSIQDDELIVPTPTGDDGEEVPLLSVESGLLGSPITKEKGIEFKALINPWVRPGRSVYIKSRGIEGFYRVRTAKFKGDTHDNDWLMTCEAVERE